MGHTPTISVERELAIGQGALIRHWFGYYYENGGFRVKNTGEDKWGGLLLLDLGDEMQSKESVGAELWLRLQVTVPLSLISVFLSYLIALPLGIFSVRKQGTALDGFLTVVLFVLYSIPTFWAGLMLILAFGATGLDWLPVLGLHDKDAASLGKIAWAWDLFLHSILPIATLTYGSFAYLSRQMRAGMLDVIRQDYIRTARAKGMSERVVIYKHALRNSMIPVITLLASILPILIGGSVIVEKVFNIPGMGMYAFEGLLRRDFNIIMATTLFVGVMTQFGILMSDITYSLVDPRIRNE
jgi:peptide/nickel transport system permease protein